VSSTIHTPPDDIKHIYRWYKKAQIDYIEQYVRLYIAYNAWYRQVTGSYNDREAISMLKKRFIVWDDYCNGRTLKSLGIYVDRLVQLTNERPLPSNSLWDGTVKDVHDWKSLIEFWYQVRCFLVHGSDVPPKYVWLAYETLDIFMAEIVRRMQLCFTDKDFQRLEELSVLASADSSKSERFKQLQRKLQAKYIDSPDIWQVDMQRAES
jgi:hypothetical protein